MAKKNLPSLDNDRIIDGENLTPPVLGGSNDADINSESHNLNLDENQNESDDVSNNESNENSEKPDALAPSMDDKVWVIRLKSTHSSSTRYRAGIKFTYDEQMVALAGLTDEQKSDLLNDDALIIGKGK